MRLKYWIKLGLQVFLWSILTCLFFGVIMLMQSSDQDYAALLLTLLSIMRSFGGLMLAVFASTTYKLYVPLTLSMGSTRREAFFGIQVYRLAAIVCFVCLFSVCNLLPSVAAQMQSDLSWKVVYSPLSAFGYYLFCGALGSLLGLFSLRFGKIATIIITLILAFFGGACGFLMSTGTFLPQFLARFSVPSAPIWIFLLGLVFHLVMTIPETKTINHCVVKL